MSKVNANKKIWGLYCPEIYQPENVEKMLEVDVWMAINNIGGALFWEMHDRGKPWRQPASIEEMTNAQYVLEYLVYYTRNYGVEFSKTPTEKEHVERSSAYLSWMLFWKNHFDSMSKEQYKEFVDAKKSGKDITKYLPSKTWQESQQEQEDKKILARKLTGVLNTQINE